MPKMYVSLCDHCNADITGRGLDRWRGWMDPAIPSSGDRVDIETCSRACLIAALEAIAQGDEGLGGSRALDA